MTRKEGLQGLPKLMPADSPDWVMILHQYADRNAGKVELHPIENGGWCYVLTSKKLHGQAKANNHRDAAEKLCTNLGIGVD